MPRRNCAAGTAGRPSRLKTRRAFFSASLGGFFSPLGRGGNVCAPQRGGGFCSSWKRGRTVAPHISFSLAREKETCRARYKEKERWERLSWRKLLLFPLCLCPGSGFPGAMRTGFTTCAAAANECGKGSFSVVRNREHLLLNAAAAQTQYNL